MADNVAITPGVGASIATEDVSGVQHQKVKVEFGGDGVATLVSSSDPLPVDLGTNNDVTVTSGTVTANAGTNLNTSALALESGGNLATIAGDTTSLDTKVTACNTGDVTVSASALPTGASTAANQSTIIGHVDGIETLLTTIDSDTSTIAGDTTSIDTKTPALGQALAAASVPVVLTAAQESTLTPQTDALTDTELRATPVPVDLGANNDVTITSGTVTANAGTNLNTSALALETGGNLATIAGDTTSLDGKVTACNTGDVTIGSALPAGTNAIGKLAANSGVDIGDVDVTSTSIDKSINGAGAPTIDSYTQASISASANTANQSLIAAPGASKQIWVYGIQFTVGTGDGSVSFQDEDDTAITGVMPMTQYSGMAQQPTGNFAMPMWKVATNKALEVDTVTCDIKGSIQYAIVSV